MPKKPFQNVTKHPAQKKHTEPVNPVTSSGQPIFGQPKPSPDPSGFKDPVTDQSLTELATLEPVPQPAPPRCKRFSNGDRSFSMP
jgi:hypothetical protein